MAIQDLTPIQRGERITAYMKRTTAQLRDLARTMGISTEGMTKTQLVGAIVERSAKAEVPATKFDMTGLYIRVGYVVGQ
ncbi:MAG: hypothetical protein M1363_04045 [Gammaproteobacteria bacterium]|nr:hypothetical protein [Gammaproteobacteria bacterium]